MQTKREGGLTKVPNPLCLKCHGHVRLWFSGEWFDYCKACCPHQEWFPYAGTGDDVCKQCGGVF